jgi:hypothetical protein
MVEKLFAFVFLLGFILIIGGLKKSWKELFCFKYADKNRGTYSNAQFVHGR